MKQRNLALMLKTVTIGTAFCGAVIFFYIFPVWGNSLAEMYPEFYHCYLPWLIFIWITAIPCFCVLHLVWRIASEIGKDNSFSQDNARYLKYISVLAFADTAIFFAGNIIYLLLNMNHPSVILISLIIVFIGVAVSVTSALLSHLVLKAAQLKEENDNFI